MIPSCQSAFRAQVGSQSSFEQQRAAFLHERFGASHILLPIYQGDPDAFLTNGSYHTMQRAWASENGMSSKASLPEILKAQIEHHRTEVFYNFDPFNFDSKFVSKLPGSVRKTIAWRAAPGHIDLSGYDLVINNFPSIRQAYQNAGIASAEFYPAHDPALDAYAANMSRDIDVLFVGGYSRHHTRRKAIIAALTGLSKRHIALHLDRSRYAWLADTPLGWFRPLSAVRVPPNIRRRSRQPVYGRQMYEQLSRARIVINVAIEMAGNDRGNMRCFEAMGARTLLLTDEGNYPSGMVDNETMIVYRNVDDMLSKIDLILADNAFQSVADAGYSAVRAIYSKQRQYTDFANLCE